MTLIIFSLQFASVQTFLTKRAASFLSKELNAEISISAIYFKPFSSLTLHDLQIHDPQGTRIFSTKRLYGNIRLKELLQNKIAIQELRITEPYVDYQIFKDSSNFTFIVDYFVPKTEETGKKKIEFSLHKVTIEKGYFILVNHNKKHLDEGIDFSNLEIRQLSGVFDNISLGETNTIHIRDLSLLEKSGFEIQKLNTKSEINKRSMLFEDLYIKTGLSIIQNRVQFDYDSFGDFSDFIEKVTIKATLKNAYVDSKDIEFFAPSMNKVQFKTQIENAELSGTVANIVANDVAFKTGKNTSLAGDFTIVGLPYIDKTIFDFKQIELKSSPEDVEFLVPLLADRSDFKLPTQLHNFENIVFNGDFKGFYNYFHVNGLFETKIGALKSNASIDIRKGLAYEGKITSTSFELGSFLNNTLFGKTGINLNFEGQNLDLKNLNLHLDGELRQFEIKNHQIESILLAGNIENQSIHLSGNIEDQKIGLYYDAHIELDENKFQYNLLSDIDHIDLKAFKIVDDDAVLVRNTSISTNLTGSTLNNLTGYLQTDKIELETPHGQFEITKLAFEAEGDENNRLLRLTSSVMDAEIKGTIDLNTIEGYFRSLAMRYAPAIGFDLKPFNPQNFDLNINIKSFSPISSFLNNSLKLDDGAYLRANFSSDDYLAKFSFFSPQITYKGLKMDKLTINEDADRNAFSLRVVADRLYLGDSLYVENIDVRNILSKDSLHFSINAAKDDVPNRLRLGGNIHFVQNRPAYIKLDNKSVMMINNDPWKINTDADLRVSKGKFYLNNLKLTHENQLVQFNGIVSDENDVLKVNFNRFGLASLDAITKPLGIHLHGELNGELDITSVFKSPNFKADISTTPIIYNQLPIGQLSFKADYDPMSDLVDIDINLLDQLNRGVKLKGYYNIDDTENPIFLSGSIKEIELVLFQPFLQKLAKNISGKASGDLKITGKINNPQFTGTAQLHRIRCTVIYLNTFYNLNEQQVFVENNKILFNNLKVSDVNNREAVINGSLHLDRINDPHVHAHVRANNFMVLNTTYKENNLYYGTALATGDFNFEGRTSAMNIDIDAATNPNTAITIPFNSAMTISDSDFIYFVERDSSNINNNKDSRFLKGLTMNMDIKITPDAEMNLQTDLGSLRGTGQGEITLKISSLGDFEMFGDYIIQSGKFHFTAQDFINKYFDIKQGGSILWSGNPENANINVTAFYQQRTSIAALYNAAGRPGQDERVLAQADMIIKGTLKDPDISFDLGFPLTPYVKDELQAYLSDANNVNQQALSLILRRSFTSTNSNNELGREVNNTLLSAGAEIAFNQLNNIISQSLNVDFLDLNIRSLNDASASLRFFDDRLIFTGGISDRRNLQTADLGFFSNRIATDAELTYRIRHDGRLMLRAYNRLNTRNILFTPTDDYINAVGLVYRQEFNTLQEFIKRMVTFRRKDESTE